MRLFEILMLLALLPVIVWPLLPWRRPRLLNFLPAAAVLLFLLHLLFEGYRWQMLPAYALVLALFLLNARRLRLPPPAAHPFPASAAAGLAALIFLALAVALPIVLPVPDFPAVSGPYALGTESFHLVDESREEIYTADPADKREIVMQLWYPAEPSAVGETAGYLDALDAMGPVLAQRLGLPAFLLDHIGLVDVGAVNNAPLLASGAPYPVLVFSHGLRGIRAQNTALVRELVSRGFVVATIDHTYGAAITAFPDGRVALYTPEVLSGDGRPPRTSNTLVKVWADDIGLVLDQLAAWNAAAGHRFQDSLDLERVGIFGHSTGGGTTVEFCGTDSRCKAAVGLDAWLSPVSDEIMAAGLERPFLLLQAEQWAFEDAGENKRLEQLLLQRSSASGYLASITGASHYDFTDVPLLSPLTAQLGLSSTIDSSYMVQMVTDMATAFFQQELQSDESNQLFATMSYPEMSLVGNGR